MKEEIDFSRLDPLKEFITYEDRNTIVFTMPENARIKWGGAIFDMLDVFSNIGVKENFINGYNQVFTCTKYKPFLLSESSIKLIGK